VLHFRFELAKYKPRTTGKNATEITVPELFKRFTDDRFKEHGLAPGSKSRYTCIQKYLSERLDMPAHQVSDRLARNFSAYLTERLSGITTKSYLYLIAASFDWAKGKYHIAELNPWSGLALKVKSNPKQRVKPFTETEIKAIIGGFRRSPHYDHYTDFVIFLFGVACRFGEAAGLRWCHIADDCQTAWIGESISRGHRKGTKTNKSRTINLSPSIAKMLSDRYSKLKPKPNDLVFPSPKGLPIDDHNFRNRAWKTVLDRCNIEYRKPYTTRHSAISHAIANGASPIDLAEQTGHDKRVLINTYAHVINKQSLFVEF
jgi:integrase